MPGPDRHRRGRDRAGAGGVARDAPARPHRLGPARPAGQVLQRDVRDHLRAQPRSLRHRLPGRRQRPGLDRHRGQRRALQRGRAGDCASRRWRQAACSPCGARTAHRRTSSVVREHLGELEVVEVEVARGEPDVVYLAHPDGSGDGGLALFMSRRSSGGSANSRLSSAERTSSHVGVAALGQPVEHAADQDLGHRRAAGRRRPSSTPSSQASSSSAALSTSRLSVRAALEGDLDEAHRVRRVGGADDDHQVGARRRSPSPRPDGSGWRSRCRRWAGRAARGTARAAAARSPGSRRPTAWSATARRPSPGRAP